MCGICGIVSNKFGSGEKECIVKRMCDDMIHRGPDHYGSVEFEEAAIGMRRLSIIDLSDAGNQPMMNEDRTVWSVCNGEIYNYEEVRAKLVRKGHAFRSQSDTEVIVHLYEEYGKDCVHMLRGMFAFAIWDTKSKELFLARDRLGIKPVYFIQSAGHFVFASEIKAIKSSGLFDLQINYQSVDNFLSLGYVPPPETMFKDIYALLPGEYALFSAGELEQHKWWDFPEAGSLAVATEEIIPRFKNLLEESIRLHQLSDVPVGAFLSGGIDSTSVVGLMSQISDKPIRTFSIGFEKTVDDTFNELTLARVVSDAFQTEHTEVIINAQDVIDHISSYISFLDQPSFDGINTYFVSKAAKEGGLTVALSGLGGDELLGGYGSYQVIPRYGNATRLLSVIPESLRVSASKLLSNMTALFSNGRRMNKLGRMGWVSSPVTLYALARLSMWPDEKNRIYAPQFYHVLEKQKIQHGRILEILERVPTQNKDLWSMVTQLELNAYMGWRLLRDTDVMSMAHSLEVRVPLIDHKLVEFVSGLAKGWQTTHGYPKKMLTTALADILPEKILNVPKHGFEFPMGHWMRNELKPILDDVFSNTSIEKRGLFSTSAIEDMYGMFKKGKLSYPTVWQFVVLELWLREMER